MFHLTESIFKLQTFHKKNLTLKKLPKKSFLLLEYDNIFILCNNEIPCVNHTESIIDASTKTSTPLLSSL